MYLRPQLLGVTVEIEARESVAHGILIHDKTFQDCATRGVDIANPLNSLTRHLVTDAIFNESKYSSAEFDAKVNALLAETDPDLQNEMIKEATLIALADVPCIPCHTRAEGIAYWPWLKNYCGESNIGDADQIYALLADIWIDQEMKEEMGY